MTRYTVNSRWDSPQISDAETVLAWAKANGAARLDFLSDALETWYEFGPKVQINADLNAVHSRHECGDPKTGKPWQSKIYRTRGVLDGLGVTDSKDDMLAFENGRDAALADLVHKYVYIHGPIAENNPLFPHIHLDPRYQIVIDKGLAGTVNTLADMTGKWWTDPEGHIKIADRAFEMFGEFTVPSSGAGGGSVSTPTTKLVFGRVPLPEDLELHDIVSNGPNTAFDWLGVRRDLGTCTHRMIGTLAGTNGYFQGEAAGRSLTDFGIGGTWDGSLDGRIYQWVPKGLDIAPWASGPANDLDGDGIAFIQALGINAVNRDLRAIELSDGGNKNNPWGPEEQARQWNAYIALMAYIFDQDEVPWDSYPLNPAVGVITDMEHWEFGPKECPFPPVRQMVNQRQAAIRAILKMHQTGVGTKPDPIPAPKPVIIPYSAMQDQTFLKRRWGSPRRVYVSGEPARDDQGKTKYYRWNPKWVPCSAWVARAKETGEFPKPGDWESIDKPKKGGPVSQIEFENGWVLLHFDDSRGWRWAGDETQKAA